MAERKKKPPIPFRWAVQRHPRRKRPQIVVTPEGEVLVKIPQRYSDRYAETLVRENLAWIAGALRRAEARREKEPGVAAFACGEGDLLPLLGDFHPIRQEGPAGYREGVFCLPGGSVEERRAEAVRVYKELAARLLRPLLESYAPVLGVTPAGLKIGRAAGSWGYCKRDGTITFSWRLICQPEDFIRYVVVHELCHLRHFDHSPAFWSEVERVSPDWKARRHDPLVGEIGRRLVLCGF